MKTKPAEYWLKRDLKGAEKEHIACVFWECPYHTVLYTKQGSERTCVPLNKSLNYWPYLNAPNWCPRRKLNGGISK